MLKTEKLSQFKRVHLRHFPGDVPMHIKYDMIDNPLQFEDKVWFHDPTTRSWKSYLVPQPNRAKSLKRDVVKYWNRKIRHQKPDGSDQEE